jgi:hypothetical protein
MNKNELRNFLLKKFDAAAADKMGYFIYDAPNINRFFVEDYAGFVKQSKFRAERFDLLFASNIPPQTLKELEEKYPGKKFFSHSGIQMVLKK